MNINKREPKPKRTILTATDFFSGLLCLIGILPGLVTYSRLPERIPIHWDIHNQPDNWAGKPFVVFCMPLLMLLFHLFCCAADNLFPASAQTHPKAVRKLVRLLIPIITIAVECVTVMYVLDWFTNVGLAACCLVGLVFLLLGNYLPKSRPNATFGIRLPWTLADEDVWRRTHRLGGWLFMLGGVAVIVSAFCGAFPLVIAVLTVVGLTPVIYSYVISRKDRDNPS